MSFGLSASNSGKQNVNKSNKRTRLYLQSLKGGSGKFDNRNTSIEQVENLSNQQTLPFITVSAIKAVISPRKVPPSSSSPRSESLLASSMDDSFAEDNNNSVERGKPRMSLDSLPQSIRRSGNLRTSGEGSRSLLFPDIHHRGSSNQLLNEETITSSEFSSKKMKKQRSSNVNNSTKIYRYKIYPGNNSRVVMAAMKRRPWWHAILNKEDKESNTGGNSSSHNNNPEEDEILQYQPSFIWEMYRNSSRYKKPQLYKHILLNRIQKNAHLVTKKGLYLSIKAYCQQHQLDMLSIIPLTFYLAPGEHSKSMKDDDMVEFQSFCESHAKELQCSVNEINFIMKPASKTNRGFGIKVVKGMTRVLNVVQRGLSAVSVPDETESQSIKPIILPKSSEALISSLDNSFSADESLIAAEIGEDTLQEGGMVIKPAAITITGTDVTSSKANQVSSPTSHKEKTKSKKSGKTHTASSNTKDSKDNTTTATTITTATSSSQHPIDAQEKNPLSKAAKKIAQQDGYIVQLYLNSPLLIHGRKFDIRCFVLATVLPSSEPGNSKGDKVLTAYFFQDAYIRTSSKKYNLANLYDREIHLTNDAVQKHSVNYGKFESGNKLSLQEWQEIINEDVLKGTGNADRILPEGRTTHNVVFDYIFPEMKRLCKLSIAAVANTFQTTDIPKSFELFGYDFMILTNFQPILIEVNTNPCLEFVNPLLTDIISTVIDQTIRLTVDKEFPPPPKPQRTKASEEAMQLIESEPLKFEPLYP